MGRVKKSPKVHYRLYYYTNTICGLSVNEVFNTTKREETTCGNCLKRLVIKRKK